MNFYEVEYVYANRGWFGMGKTRRKSVTFAATDTLEALRIADRDGKRMFPKRTKWHIETVTEKSAGEYAFGNDAAVKGY